MNIVIIGNGISGITAARWIRKLSDHKITVVSSESDHFFSRTALMYIYMGHMRYEDTKPYEDWFWQKNRIGLVNDHVDSVDFNKKICGLASGGNIKYDKLILATGSKSNKFGWPGQDLNGVRGLYNLQDLAEMEKHSPGLERAVIVGGGLIGIEMAEMFHSRDIPVTMLVREDSFWDMVLPPEESAMVSQHIVDNHIDLKLNVNLEEILDDGNGKVRAVKVKETGEEIACGFVGLTPGVSPNIDFLKDGELEIQRGIVVDEHLQTNLPDVYAIGDCAQLRNPQEGRRPIEAVWYTGRMMGETLAYNICGKAIKYNPGIWFNSAKFIDIEYQVYGEVPAQLADNQSALFWKHNDNTKSVRLVYDKHSKVVLGFNLFGIRYRHEVCEKWLNEKTNVEEVLTQLSLANFDPEFYDLYEQEIITQYNNQSGKKLKLKRQRGLNAVLSFLST